MRIASLVLLFTVVACEEAERRDGESTQVNFGQPGPVGTNPGGGTTTPGVEILPPPANCGPVEVTYTDDNAGVLGDVFGLKDGTNVVVTGTIGYDTCTAGDRNGNDPNVGYYELGDAVFTATIDGTVSVRGSGAAEVDVEFGASNHTFRWLDGTDLQNIEKRVMYLDNVEDSELYAFWVFSDSDGQTLTSDQLPRPFPTYTFDQLAANTPHTFRIGRENEGELVIQLEAMELVVP